MRSFKESRSQRERNRRHILLAIRETGSISQADLARLTGFSRSTVSSIVAELKAGGILVEQGLQAPLPSGGRPALNLSLRRDVAAAIAIDFAEDRLRVAVSDLGLCVLARSSLDLGLATSRRAVLQSASVAIEEALSAAGVDRGHVLGVGISVPSVGDGDPGPEAWSGTGFAEEMEERLGLPVRIETAANLAALAELVIGAARGASDAVYVNAGIAISAGIILGGRLHRGAAGGAGRLGHTIVDENGALCYCGNRGCLETVAGGPAIVRQVAAVHSDADFDAVLRLAINGDPACRRALSDAGRHLGLAVADLCHVLDPEIVVIGGLLSQAGDLVLDGVRDSMRRCGVLTAAKDSSVVSAALGDDAELLGALALVLRGPNAVFAERLLTRAVGANDSHDDSHDDSQPRGFRWKSADTTAANRLAVRI